MSARACTITVGDALRRLARADRLRGSKQTNKPSSKQTNKQTVEQTTKQTNRLCTYRPPRKQPHKPTNQPSLKRSRLLRQKGERGTLIKRYSKAEVPKHTMGILSGTLLVTAADFAPPPSAENLRANKTTNEGIAKRSETNRNNRTTTQ